MSDTTLDVALSLPENGGLEEGGLEYRALRVQVVNRPGALTGVAQILSSMNVNIETMTLATDRHEDRRGEVRFAFLADVRTTNLVCRKLMKLFEVLHVELISPAAVSELARSSARTTFLA
jgi:acetolactate synthase small subunit